jgi:hypothetical protein
MARLRKARPLAGAWLDQGGAWSLSNSRRQQGDVVGTHRLGTAVSGQRRTQSMAEAPVAIRHGSKADNTGDGIAWRHGVERV